MNENAPTLVTMYTTGSCPYCLNAKSLLSRLHAQVTEKRIDTHDAYREEMKQRTNGARTVPQIFIGEAYIGGFDALQKLHLEKRLEPMLKI